MPRAFVGLRYSSQWPLLFHLPQHSATLHRKSLSAFFSCASNAKQRIALPITKVNFHGDGVGTFVSNDRVKRQVIVPFTSPGDLIQAEIWERDVEKGIDIDSQNIRRIFGQQVELLESSKHRVNPLCNKYFGVCGGCKLQHVRYEQQLREKQQWILDLFSHCHHSPDLEIRDILGVKLENDKNENYQYRNKMEFTCSTGRWLLEEDKSLHDVETNGQNNSFTVGMFPISSVHSRRSKEIFGKKKARRRRAAMWSPRILSIDKCELQDPACNALLQQIVAKCTERNVQAYDFKTHKGFLKQIVLRRGTNGHGRKEIMLGFVTTEFHGRQSQVLQNIVQNLVLEHELNTESNSPHLVSIIESLDQEAHRHRRQEKDVMPTSIENCKKERVLYGEAHFEDTILGHRFKISFDSFFQPNSVQASVLYREIQRMIAALPKKPVVWDLFCGVGSIGICMGAYAKKVVGFELIDAAVQRAKVNAYLNGYTSEHMQFFCVDLTKKGRENAFFDAFAFHPNGWERPDVIIVDPPRAGLHHKLIQQIRRLAPRYICYVSCNPRSQVVDLEALCVKAELKKDQVGCSYQVQRLQPVDMLPHTPHVETIAWLERWD